MSVLRYAKIKEDPKANCCLNCKKKQVGWRGTRNISKKNERLTSHNETQFQIINSLSARNFQQMISILKGVEIQCLKKKKKENNTGICKSS